MATLQVTKREKTGKYDAFNLRRQGRLPAVVYGKGKGNLEVSAALKDFQALLKGGQPIFDLVVDGAAPCKVALNAVQHGTYDTELLHADFQLVDENEPIQLELPIEVKGEAKGTREGGVLELETPLVTVRCLPKDLPDAINVEVGDLGIGDIVFIDQLPEIAGVSYVYHGRPAIVSCRHPQRHAAAAEVAEGPTQPEVMAEKASEARAADKK